MEKVSKAELRIEARELRIAKITKKQSDLENLVCQQKRELEDERNWKFEKKEQLQLKIQNLVFRIKKYEAINNLEVRKIEIRRMEKSTQDDQIE